MNHTLNIIVVGATGKMGQTLIQEIHHDNQTKLVGALDHEKANHLGEVAGYFCGIKTGIVIQPKFDAISEKADILIDFTRPEASNNYIDLCQKNKINYVLGTTGFSEAEKDNIANVAKNIAICFAPNMSIGINLLLSLVESATAIMHEDFDIEIIESHHKDKVDAPSGTALSLGESVAKSSGRSLKEHGTFKRTGIMPSRKRNEIGFSVIRGGDIVGDHTVLYAGDGERIELTHKASNRKTFAKGALRAAKFLADKTNGLFDMQDVLGLKQ